VIHFFRRRPKDLGRYGERLSARRLKRHGYRILERNVRYGGHELDIIAQKGDTVAFVEVKTRQEEATLQPDDNLSKAQERRIAHAAAIYQQRRDDPSLYYRFDLIAVVVHADKKPSITWYEDAFRADF